MGQLDQFAKQMFAEETQAVTHGALAWLAPPEIGFSEVRLDGLLKVLDPAALAAVAAPWSAARGHDEIVLEMVQMVPMTTALNVELFEFIETTEPEIIARQLRLLKGMIKRHPEVLEDARKDERDQWIEQGLAPVVHQFERKLAWRLDEGEHRILHERLTRLGPDRVGDVVIDLDAAALTAWLADPAAK